MSDTEVGGIKGFLDLDDSAWDRKIAKAKNDVRELKAMNADVRVSVDADRAEERIAMLHAAVRALDAESATIDVKVVERAGGGGSAASRAAVDVQAQLAEAQEKVAVASMKADLAQQRLDEAEEKGTRTASELTAKRIALAEAQNRESALIDRATGLTQQLSAAQDRAANGADSSAGATRRMNSAMQDAEVALQRATIAQMRLDDVLSKNGSSGARVAAATLARDSALAQAVATRQAASADGDLSAAQARAAVTADVQAAASRANAEAAERAGQSFSVGSSRAGLMAVGITSVISTVGPLAGALTAAGGAALGMGAAGVLAVFGIKTAMDQGTAAGQAYGAGLASLKGDLDSLAATSAGAMLTHFQQAEQTITNDMPALRGQVVGFADSLGEAGNAILTGLVKGFQVANPLMEQGQRLIVRVADGFESWASGNGLATFANEASHDLPIVVRGIGDLASGAVALLGAMRPVGLVVIEVAGCIGQIAQVAASAGPVLPALAAGAGAAWLGFKVWEGAKAIGSSVQAGITVMSASMDALMGASTRSAAATTGQAAAQAAVAATAPAAAAGEAAVAEGAVAMNTAMAANPVGLIIGLLAGLAAVTFVAMNATKENTAATTDYTSALQQDGDAIGQYTTKQIAQQLQQAKVVSTAKQYGLTLSDLTKSVTGNADSQQKVSDVLDTQIKKYEEQAAAARLGSNGQSAAAKIAGEHVDALKKLQTEIDSQTKAVAKQKSQQDQANSASNAATNAIKSNADAYGMTTGAYQKATDAAKKQAASTREATQAMQLENDAAGLLTNALTLLNGGALSVAQAQTGVYSATNQAKDAFKENGAAIEGNSAAAVANQQAIQGQVQAAQQMAEAQSKATGSTSAGVEAYKKSKSALEDALRAQGQLTPAVQDYINKLYDVSNLKVEPTKLDVNKTAADTALDALKKHIASVPKTHDTKTDALISDAQAKLNALKGSISSVPASKQTELKAAIATAQANLDAIKSSIAQIPTSKTITITTNHVNVADGSPGNGAGVMLAKAHGGTIQSFADGGTSGGSVWGSKGSAFSDSLLTRLSIGEEVASAQAMSFPGARSVVKAINANPATAMQAIAGGQQPSGDVKVTVVNKTGVTLSDLIDIKIERAAKRSKQSAKAGRQQ